MHKRDLLIERWNPTEVNERGTAIWKNDKGEVHRGGDQPAIVSREDSMGWYKNGERHRGGDKPAFFHYYGMEWHNNDKRHRGEDRPAIVYIDNDMSWYKNGRLYHPSQEIQEYWSKYYKEYFDNLKKHV